MRRSRERDRALELRAHVRDASIALAAAGTIVLAGVAAATLPGTSPSGTGLQAPGQPPAAAQGGGSAVSGGSTVPGSTGGGGTGSGLQAPAQPPGSAQGGGISGVTGAS